MDHLLSFDEFSKYIRENLLVGWWEDREMKIQKIKKNNGLELTGMTLPKKGQCVMPTFYLEEFYNDYLECHSAVGLLLKIRQCYEQAELMGPSIDDVEKMTSYEGMCNNIIFRMVNYNKNREMLKECPHVRIYDMAVTFRIVYSWDDISISSALITNDHMEDWEVSKDELLVYAERNTRRMFPALVRSMSETIRLFEDEAEEDMEDCDVCNLMFILSNRQMMNGASVILYDELLENIAEEVEANYFLLPSSIHEMILVPDYMGMDREVMLNMVREANRTVIEEEDFLSDSIYYFNKEKSCLECYGS